MPRDKRDGAVETGDRLDKNPDSLDPDKRTQADLDRLRRDFTDREADDAPSSLFANHEEASRAEVFADQWMGTKSQEAFTPRGPRGYRRSDASIREDITEYLNRDGQIDASRIQVAVEDGEVTLTGTTLTREEKRLAEIVAEQCAGVKAVRNELRVYQRDLCQRDLFQEDNQKGQEPREGEWGQPDDPPLSAARAN